MAAPRRLLFSIKIVAGVALLAFLFFRGDDGWRAFGLLAGIQTKSIGALLALSLCMNWLSSLKWMLILRARGASVSASRLMALYLIGKFFGNFAPGMVGGDVARVVMLAGHGGSQAQSAASVLLERFTGMVALVFLAIVAVASRPELIGDPVIGLSILGISVGCVAALTMLYLPRTGQRFPPAGSGVWRRTAAKLDSLYAEVAFFKGRYGLLAATLALSIVFYALASVAVYVSCLAVGFDASYGNIARATPVIYLVTAIPVSPGNLGWWEWCVGLLLQQSGSRLAEGLAVGLLIRAVSLCMSLLGGLLFLGYRSRRSI